MQFLDPEFCTHRIPLGASQPPTSLVVLLSFVVDAVQKKNPPTPPPLESAVGSPRALFGECQGKVMAGAAPLT